MDRKINPKVKLLTTTALMAAVIFVVTYIIRIPLPFASGGYLNIGDAPIYVAAALLGGPAGAVAAAIGSALSDLSAGYVVYVLPTAVVKGLMGLVCGSLMRRAGFRRFVIASAIGGAIMVGGYAAFESVLFNTNQAIASIPFNAIQWVAGVAVAAALYPAVARIKKTLGMKPAEPNESDPNKK
ncbi:MAG: ECF transporter S component [Clostridiales Family XIII bacterium]|jgi:uncharacterized membrane protein|nr:ECF transporter S component [Clostridiales Family XIII bacterium]